MIAYEMTINPIAFSIGPLVVRWYALAYISGLLFALYYSRFVIRRKNLSLPRNIFDDFLGWAVVAILIGGRLGYIIFYHLDYYIKHPMETLQVWHGGMAFHGALLAVLMISFIFCKRIKVSFLTFSDVITLCAPIGIFFGRLANFVNSELYGLPTKVCWGVVFPTVDLNPRHPTQIYEALGEGLFLFALLNTLAFKTSILKKPGSLMFAGLVIYGTIRFVLEYFKALDASTFLNITRGQWLCLGMIIFGLLGFLRKNAFHNP